MDISDLDIYDDLDQFQEKEDKNSAELLALEEKYKEALETIEQMANEAKSLHKTISIMQSNCQLLLDTAKAEIQRKDRRIAALEQEKDDICFRRNKATVGYKETVRSENNQHYGANPFKATTASTSQAASASRTEFAADTVAAFSDGEIDYSTDEYEPQPEDIQAHNIDKSSRPAKEAWFNRKSIHDVEEIETEESPKKHYKRQYSPEPQDTLQKMPNYKHQPYQLYEQHFSKRPRFEEENEYAFRRDRCRDPRSNRNYKHNWRNVEYNDSDDRAIDCDNKFDRGNRYYQSNRHNKHKYKIDDEDRESDERHSRIRSYEEHRDFRESRYNGNKYRWHKNAENWSDVRRDRSRGRYDWDSANDHRRDRSRGRNHYSRFDDQHDSQRYGHANEYEMGRENGKYSMQENRSDSKPNKRYRRDSLSECFRDAKSNPASQMEKRNQRRESREYQNARREVSPQERMAKSNGFAENPSTQTDAYESENLASVQNTDITIKTTNANSGPICHRELDTLVTSAEGAHLMNGQVKDPPSSRLNIENPGINTSSKAEIQSKPQNANSNANNGVEKGATLRTSKNVALFDRLFGPSTYNNDTENSNERLENVVKIISSNSSSATTSPGAYSDVNEVEDDEDDVIKCRKEAKGSNINDSNDKSNEQAVENVDNYFTPIEKTKSSVDAVCDPQIESTNHDREVAESLLKLKEISTPSEKVLQNLSNGEVIEIDDDTDANYTDDEIIFKRVTSGIDNKQPVASNCVPPQKNEINQKTKPLIEIIEDIRLPAVLPIEDIMKSSIENDAEEDKRNTENEIQSSHQEIKEGKEHNAEEFIESSNASTESNVDGRITEISEKEEIAENREESSVINLDDDGSFDEKVNNELKGLDKIIECELDEEILLGHRSSERKSEPESIETTENSQSNKADEIPTEQTVTNVADDNEMELSKGAATTNTKKSKSKSKKKLHKESRRRDEKQTEEVSDLADQQKNIQIDAEQSSEDVLYAGRKTVQIPDKNDNDREHEEASNETLKSDNSKDKSSFPDEIQDQEFNKISDESDSQLEARTSSSEQLAKAQKTPINTKNSLKGRSNSEEIDSQEFSKENIENKWNKHNGSIDIKEDKNIKSKERKEKVEKEHQPAVDKIANKDENTNENMKTQGVERETLSKDTEGEILPRKKGAEEKESNGKDEKNLEPPEKEIESKKKTKQLNKTDRETNKISKHSSNNAESKTAETIEEVCNKTKALQPNKLPVDKTKDNNNFSSDEKRHHESHQKATLKRRESEKNNEANINDTSRKSKEIANDKEKQTAEDILCKNTRNEFVENKTVVREKTDGPLKSVILGSIQKTENADDGRKAKDDEKKDQNGPEEKTSNSTVPEVTSKSRTNKRRHSVVERTTEHTIVPELDGDQHEYLSSEKSQGKTIRKRRRQSTNTQTRELNNELSAAPTPIKTRNTKRGKEKAETILRAKDVLQMPLEYVEKLPENIPEKPEKKAIKPILLPSVPARVDPHIIKDDEEKSDAFTRKATAERQNSSRSSKSKSPTIAKTVANRSKPKPRRRNSKFRCSVDHFSSSDDDTDRKTFINIFRNNSLDVKHRPLPAAASASEIQPKAETINNSIASAAAVSNEADEKLQETEQRRSGSCIQAPSTPDHVIFHSEPSNLLAKPELPTFNAPQDEKYRDIDSRMQSMFQSPPHVRQQVTATVDATYSPPHEHEQNMEPKVVSNTSLAVVATPPPPPAESITNTSPVDTVGETVNQENQHKSPLLNTSNEVKCVSLGNSEYRIEKISANVAKVSIKRRRHKKKIQLD